jgi:VWFA-related protein
LVFHLVACPVPPAGAQPIGQLTINYIEASPAPEQAANEVRVYLTVSDSDENPISGLSAGDFEALEDGRPIDIQEVSQTTDPMAVVLALDTSGSMQALDKSGRSSMELAKRAAVEFISLLSPEDRVAVFSFNNAPALQLDFTTDHAAAVEAVSALRAKPNAATCLYDTAYEAVKKSAEIPRGRRAIVLLTDGRDEKGKGLCSTYSSNDVIDAATTKTIRVPIYTIGAGPRVDAKELARMAHLTGGRSLLSDTAAGLSGLYQTVANQLKYQYALSYFTQSASGEHSLVVKARLDGTTGQDEKRFWSPPLPVVRPPSVEIIRPQSGQEVEGEVRVRVRIEPEDAVEKVRLYIGAALKAEHSSPPFDVFVWNTEGLAGGLHVLRVEVIDLKGQSGVAETTVKVKAPPPRPEPVPKPAVEKKKGIPPVLWIVGLVVLMAMVGVVLWLKKRGKAGAAAEEWKPDQVVRPQETGVSMDFDADETQYIGDIGPTVEAMMAGAGDRKPLATLTVVKSMNLDPGKTFEIINGSTTVGRTSGNDIFIPDKPVSRKHAEITHEDGIFYIKDLGSKNGTKLDEQLVSEEGARLYDGVRIQLSSKTILEFNTLPSQEEADEEATRIVHDEPVSEDEVTNAGDVALTDAGDAVTQAGDDVPPGEDEATNVSEDEDLSEDDSTKVYDR